MSLLIKGMNMPKNCGWCPCVEQEQIYDANGLVGVRYYCQAIENLPFKSDKAKITDVDQKLENCPLSEIPTPHGRLIDADRLYETIEQMEGFETIDNENDVVLSAVEVLTAIDEAPTIIEAEE